MCKTLKILLIIAVLISSTFIFNYSYATSGSSENVIREDSSSQTPLSSLTPTSSSSITDVTPLNDYNTANLQLNNILCFILIAIGIVIILLAIAILFKLKK